jgi:hypothetical protein
MVRAHMHRVFLLSPAHSGGLRAQMLTRPGASFELVRLVQIGDATIGQVFSFCSGLYFRGKLAYARHFASPPNEVVGAQVITSSRGLISCETQVGAGDLREFASVPVDCAEPRYTQPLIEAVTRLAKNRDCDFVLLGSVATGK